MDTLKIPKLSRINKENKKEKPLNKPDKKAEKPNKKEKAPKRKRKFHINWLLVFAMLCVAIPAGALGWILWSAQRETGEPQNGGRFEGDFAYVLVAEDLNKIADSLKGLDGVEKIQEINLKVATLRIYIDTVDSLSDKQITDLAEKAYKTIDGLYPISEYFTNHDTVAQYDLEIYIYNNFDFEDNLIYYRLVKNAPAETYVLQNVGKPLDAKLAERLRAEETISEAGVNGTEDASETDEEEIAGDD